MAQTRDLIVRGSTGDTKSFIRIGDMSPQTPSVTGSTIQFLQNLSSSTCTFDTAGTTSAFRIRHDTVGGYLVFQGRSGSSQKVNTLMTLNDDTQTVTFGGTVAFDDIRFDEITGSYLFIGTSSRFNGNVTITGSQRIIFTSSLGTASIWYNPVKNKLEMNGGGGNSWKTQWKTTASITKDILYPVYTTSANQLMQNYNYLSVYLNGSLLYASGSTITDWDYKTGSSLTDPKISFNYNLPYSTQDQWWLGYVYSGGSD